MKDRMAKKEVEASAAPPEPTKEDQDEEQNDQQQSGSGSSNGEGTEVNTGDKKMDADSQPTQDETDPNELTDSQKRSLQNAIQKQKKYIGSRKNRKTWELGHFYLFDYIINYQRI